MGVAKADQGIPFPSQLVHQALSMSDRRNGRDPQELMIACVKRCTLESWPFQDAGPRAAANNNMFVGTMCLGTWQRQCRVSSKTVLERQFEEAGAK